MRIFAHIGAVDLSKETAWVGRPGKLTAVPSDFGHLLSDLTWPSRQVERIIMPAYTLDTLALQYVINTDVSVSATMGSQRDSKRCNKIKGTPARAGPWIILVGGSHWGDLGINRLRVDRGAGVVMSEYSGCIAGLWTLSSQMSNSVFCYLSYKGRRALLKISRSCSL